MVSSCRPSPLATPLLRTHVCLYVRIERLVGLPLLWHTALCASTLRCWTNCQTPLRTCREMPKESATPKRASKRPASSAAASTSAEKKPKSTPAAAAKKPGAHPSDEPCRVRRVRHPARAHGVNTRRGSFPSVHHPMRKPAPSPRSAERHGRRRRAAHAAGTGGGACAHARESHTVEKGGVGAGLTSVVTGAVTAVCSGRRQGGCGGERTAGKARGAGGGGGNRGGGCSGS